MFVVSGHKEICLPVLLFFDDFGGNTLHVLKCFCPVVTCLTSMEQNLPKKWHQKRQTEETCLVSQSNKMFSPRFAECQHVDALGVLEEA